MSVLYYPRIPLVLDAAGRWDARRLARALRLLADAEPILGCRLIVRFVRPYWRRWPATVLDAHPFLRVVEGDADALAAAEAARLASPLDDERGPRFDALLLRGERGDRLVLRVDHHVADAGGVKEIAARLASLYRRLADEPDHRPEPNLGSRSLRQVYRRFPAARLARALLVYVRDTALNLVPFATLHVPRRRDERGPLVHLVRRYDRGVVDRLRERAGARGATLNDLLVAAFLRALLDGAPWNRRDAVRFMGTVDLRRYLPGERGEAPCNLSSFFFLRFGNDPGKDFDGTLARVKARIDALKGGDLGLPFLLGSWAASRAQPAGFLVWWTRALFGRLALSRNMAPGFTNMGEIGPAATDFGGPEVTAAALIVPPTHGGAFIPGVSTHRGTLTLSAGFHESTVPRAVVERLFDDAIAAALG